MIIVQGAIFYDKRSESTVSVRIYIGLAFPYDKKNITLRGNYVRHLCALSPRPTLLPEAKKSFSPLYSLWKKVK